VYVCSCENTLSFRISGLRFVSYVRQESEWGHLHTSDTAFGLLLHFGPQANGSKSIRITCTTRRETCPPGHVNNVKFFPEKKLWSILGYNLPGDLPGTNTFLQNGNNQKSPSPNCIDYLDASQNSSQATNFSYIKQLWGTVSTSNIEIIELFQRRTLRMIVNAPWYVPNTVIRRDLQIPAVKEEIRRYSSQYNARLSSHPNDLLVNLMGLPDDRRLRRHLPNDLYTRFLVVVFKA
jgi:hypothetical protein